MSYELPTCVKCGDEYSLHDGFEPTDYCDSCAQELVPELLAALKTISNRLTKGPRHNASDKAMKLIAAVAEAALSKAGVR